MKTRVSYAHCQMFVEGLDMNCPLCGLFVKSGQRHECSKPETQCSALSARQRSQGSASGRRSIKKEGSK